MDRQSEDQKIHGNAGSALSNNHIRNSIAEMILQWDNRDAEGVRWPSHGEVNWEKERLSHQNKYEPVSKLGNKYSRVEKNKR